MLQLTPMAVTKVKEILSQQSAVAGRPARCRRRRRLLGLQLSHGL